MFRWTLVLLLSLKGFACDESGEASTITNNEVSVAEEIPEDDPPVTEAVTSDTIGDINDITPRQLQPSRPPRRRPRRPRGYYNDMRYRNPVNNPYNPNSPYAFRGRPGQPPMVYRQQAYSEQYYDPYNQYYGYQGYAPVQPQQQPYYPYPYPPQARIPHPQPVTSPPPADAIPELYYVQKADTPDGQYQYKRVSVLQDSYYENRGRRRPTRPQQAYGGYYNYPYNPYDRRPPPPPPPPQQTYYQPYQYPNQYPSYYYPRVPGVSRSRLRTGKPPFRSTSLSSSWKLTLAPLTTNNPPLENEVLTDITNEPSVN